MIPKVSVVVAAYNVEKYIERCLSSLRNQTLREIEFLIVNDGSTDNTKKICEAFEQMDSRFRLISQKNGGLSEARNTGIQNANAHFIAFVDADDYVHETFYEKLYKTLIKENADVVICDFIKVWEDQRLNIVKSKRSFFNNSLLKEDIITNFLTRHDESFVVAWNKLYKLEIIKQHNISFLNKAFFEDVGFMSQYVMFAKKINYLSEPLYNYVQRDGSITKSYNPIIEESLKNTMDLVGNCFIDKRNTQCIRTFNLRLLLYSYNYFLQNSVTKHSLKKEIMELKDCFKNIPLKHKIALYLLKLGIYELIYKKVYKLKG